MAKLKDIAQELGVSVSMVSRVLTDKDRVDPKKRKLIQEALIRHQYVPNEMARGLRGYRSQTLGIIVPTLSGGYYPRIVVSAQEAAMKKGYTVMVCCSGGDPEKEKEAVRTLEGKKLIGLLCASALPKDDPFYSQQCQNSNVIFFDCPLPEKGKFGYIGFDEKQAAGRLAQYAADLGYQRFLLLDHMYRPERTNWFRNELCSRGISEIVQVCGLRKNRGGYEKCQEQIRELTVPAAVLCSDDELAYLSVLAARELGLRVPEDISVAGFDVFDDTGLLSPDLTCICQSAKKIGQLAVEMLLDETCEGCMVEVEFHEGNSFAKVR